MTKRMSRAMQFVDGGYAGFVRNSSHSWTVHIEFPGLRLGLAFINLSSGGSEDYGHHKWTSNTWIGGTKTWNLLTGKLEPGPTFDGPFAIVENLGEISFALYDNASVLTEATYAVFSA
jgi:hypothetical protein